MTFLGFDTFSEVYFIVFGCLAVLVIATGLVKSRRRKKTPLPYPFIRLSHIDRPRGRSPHSKVYQQQHRHLQSNRRERSGQGSSALRNTRFFGIRALEAGFCANVVQMHEVPRQSSVMRQRRLNDLSQIHPAQAFESANIEPVEQVIPPDSYPHFEESQQNVRDRVTDDYGFDSSIQRNRRGKRRSYPSFQRPNKHTQTDHSGVQIDGSESEPRARDLFITEAHEHFSPSQRRYQGMKEPTSPIRRPKRAYRPFSYPSNEDFHSFWTENIDLRTHANADAMIRSISSVSPSIGVRFPDDLLVRPVHRKEVD